TTSTSSSTHVPTTTTLPGTCDDGATIDATLCRIAALRTLVEQTPGLDPVRDRLLAAIGQLEDLVREAAADLANGDAASAAKAPMRARTRVTRIQRGLRSLRTRLTIPDDARLRVLDAVTDVATHLKAVRAVVKKPGR